MTTRWVTGTIAALSATIMPDRIKRQPTSERPVSTSPVSSQAKMAEKTGSMAKIRATWVGVVNRWALL